MKVLSWMAAVGVLLFAGASWADKAAAVAAKDAKFCQSSAGILALLAGGAATGQPRFPAPAPTDGSTVFNWEARVTPARLDPASRLRTCAEKLEGRIYVALNRADLAGLPALAQRNDVFSPPTGVFVEVARATVREATNDVQYRATLNARAGLPAGSVAFYRVARKVNLKTPDSNQFPYVFGETFEFRIAPAAVPPPQAAAQANLVPDLHTEQNRKVFKSIGGTYVEDDASFLAIDESFCLSVLKNGTAVGSHGGKKLTINLGDITYSARNPGGANAGTFVVELFRRDVINGVRSNLVSVKRNTVNSLNAGQGADTFTFQPNKQVTVHVFPESNPGLCFAKCETPGGCNPPYFEEEYEVRVDGGNGAAGGGQVAESRENDNSGNPMKR